MRSVKILKISENAQADLNFPWAHMSEGMFSDVAANMLCYTMNLKSDSKGSDKSLRLHRLQWTAIILEDTSTNAAVQIECSWKWY